jgi:hypothetical protein
MVLGHWASGTAYSSGSAGEAARVSGGVFSMPCPMIRTSKYLIIDSLVLTSMLRGQKGGLKLKPLAALTVA